MPVSGYEALARKYRPQTFDDVLAQSQVTQTLKNAITMGRIHHAYLFCGPRGTGKTTTARILAKALNCVNGPTPEPCNQCDSCVGITNGADIDVIEIDAASNTGVDDIRELRESSRYVPAASRFKIYIIDEVHRLSKSAFDALLKTLEEPPPTVKFLFATTEPNSVPATVRSRALRFDFHLVAHDAIRSQLQRIAEAEHITVDTESLDILAAEAQGSIRDSQSLLDQISAYADGAITADITTEALGLVGSDALFAFSNAIASSDPAAALEVVSDVSRSGRDFAQFVLQLNEHVKRLLFARSLGDRFADPALSGDGQQRYRDAARALDENDWKRLLLMSIETARSVKRSPQPRLEMEIFALRVTQMDRSIDIRKLVDRLDGASGGTQSTDLFQNRASQTTTGSRPHSAPPPTTARHDPQASSSAESPAMQSSPQATAVAEKPISQSISSASTGQGHIDFGPIRESICRTRPTLQAVLGEAELVRVGDGIVDLNVYNGSTFHQRQLGHKPIRDLIHAEIAQVLGAGIRVRVHVKDGPSPSGGSNGGNGASQKTTPRRSTDSSESSTENDHNLQEILRRFDGEIVN